VTVGGNGQWHAEGKKNFRQTGQEKSSSILVWVCLSLYLTHTALYILQKHGIYEAKMLHAKEKHCKELSVSTGVMNEQ